MLQNEYLDAKIGVDTEESPLKFDDSAEKSEKSSVSNLSTKAQALVHEQLRELEERAVLS